MSNDPPSYATLRRLVADHVATEPSQVRLKTCSTGKQNQTYFVDVADQSLVLRVAPPDDPAQMLFYEYRMMRQEPSLHFILREQTDCPVPEILAFDASHRRIGRDCLLMERMPGTPLSGFSGLTDRLFEWGDPEIEFAVLDYCGISEPAFWEGYAAERERSREAEVRRMFYLLYEVQKYIFIRRVRRNRPIEAERYRQQSFRLARPLACGGG